MEPASSGRQKFYRYLAASSDPSHNFDRTPLGLLMLLAVSELSVVELAIASQLTLLEADRQLKWMHDHGWIIKRSEGTASLYRLDEGSLDPDLRRLWETTRERLESSPAFLDDAIRLKKVLADRRSDSQGADEDPEADGDPFVEDEAFAGPETFFFRNAFEDMASIRILRLMERTQLVDIVDLDSELQLGASSCNRSLDRMARDQLVSVEKQGIGLFPRYRFSADKLNSLVQREWKMTRDHHESKGEFDNDDLLLEEVLARRPKTPDSVTDQNLEFLAAVPVVRRPKTPDSVTDQNLAHMPKMHVQTILPVRLRHRRESMNTNTDHNDFGRLLAEGGFMFEHLVRHANPGIVLNRKKEERITRITMKPSMPCGRFLRTVPASSTNRRSLQGT